MSRLTIRLLTVVLFVLTIAAPVMAQGRTENVVLVTLDGVRHQEIFGGLDRDILQSTAGSTNIETLDAYRRYWAPTPEERRRRVMPFFWGTLAARGFVAGGVSNGSSVKVTNRHRFSYPGYSEILTGYAYDDAVKSNDLIQNPNETVLEFVRRKLRLPSSKVAAFASWNVFAGIVEHTKGAVTSNAGMAPFSHSDPLVAQISQLQFDVLPPWDGIRHDTFTFRMAMAYLKREKPRLLYLALDETDDWAHDGKYFRALETLERTDRQLKELVEWLDSDPQYRGKTTLILTTDHGRGSTAKDWRSHGQDIEGAQDIWLAAFGPETLAQGVWSQHAPIFQNQIAATIARLFGLDFSELRPAAGAPIAAITGR